MTAETKKTEFPTATGEKLAASLELPSGTPRAFALFAHCFSCTKDIKAAREIARHLRGEGFAVLRFDFTGLGSSEGDFANTNFSSNVDDLVSAADFLRDEFEAPSILIGHSLGGAAAIVAAARVPEVKGVATIGAPAHADHVLDQLGERRAQIEKDGIAEVQLAGRPFTVKKQFIDDLSNQHVLDAASALKRPLLVMHAPRDATVGIENATEIFIAAKHPKSFVSLDTADHLLTTSADAQYAADVLAAWAARFVGGVRAESSVRAPAPDIASISGGARAISIPHEPLAVQASIDGFPFVIDASKAEGGSDLGPNPTRTLEAALAACVAITLRMYARRKKWPLASVDVSVRRAPSEDDHSPHVLEKTVSVTGELDDAQRARLMEIADKCPVHRMLSDGVKVQSRAG